MCEQDPCADAEALEAYLRELALRDRYRIDEARELLLELGFCELEAERLMAERGAA